MKLVFMGTGDFAVPALQTLLDSPHEIAALITQPDKPAGRGHELRAPRTKTIALAKGVAVHQPARVRGEDTVALLREIAPDCIVVVAYGQIIPQSILDIPPKGIINVHGSLLPHYRGAAPVQWAIARGETETGVTTMLMDQGLDTGPILEQRTCPIERHDTGGTLQDKLARLGAELLLTTLVRWGSGELVPTPQDDSLASLAPRIKKADGLVEWTLAARDLECRVRAFDPWPVAYVVLDGSPVRIWKARVSESAQATTAQPGTIVSIERDALVVACGDASFLELLELQPAGKSHMSGAAFARGKRLSQGDRLG